MRMSDLVHHFPKDMVPLLRCNNDAGELTIVEQLRGGGDGIMDAVLRWNHAPLAKPA